MSSLHLRLGAAPPAPKNPAETAIKQTSLSPQRSLSRSAQSLPSSSVSLTSQVWICMEDKEAKGPIISADCHPIRAVGFAHLAPHLTAVLKIFMSLGHTCEMLVVSLNSIWRTQQPPVFTHFCLVLAHTRLQLSV